MCFMTACGNTDKLDSEKIELIPDDISGIKDGTNMNAFSGTFDGAGGGAPGAEGREAPQKDRKREE